MFIYIYIYKHCIIVFTQPAMTCSKLTIGTPLTLSWVNAGWFSY